jgi:hypothetical protein
MNPGLVKSDLNLPRGFPEIYSKIPELISRVMIWKTYKKKMIFLLIFPVLLVGPGIVDFSLKAFSKETDVSNRTSASEINEAQRNYLQIKEYYSKWQIGLFGSSRAYLRKLKSHLAGIIGKRIETDKSFIIESPGSPVDKKLVCKLLECRWLKLHGMVDVHELKELVEKDRTLVNRWWRSGLLFTVSGRVRKFRIGRDSYGDTVELFLEIIKVHKP